MYHVMAFISKLLASRNSKSTGASNSYKKCPNSNFVCHELFTFAVEQVQVAVFRECDFRGRKLLFDSKSVERVSSDTKNNVKNERKSSCEQSSEFVEITNGFGYSLKKPNGDISHLAEMIFGSVAMSYRGNLYKIHNLELPPRLVFSQVFPSPRMKCCTRQTSIASKSVDYPLQLDDSLGSGSSRTSYSDQSNSDLQSSISDVLSICRRRQHSVPLDMPLNSSLISSSGYGGELSTSSLSSGPPSIAVDDCCRLSHLFLDNSTHRSLPTSICLDNDIRGLRHRRASKLGLAIILQITRDQEKRLVDFLMHHIACIETILKRVRQEVEIAYIHHHTFVSEMFELSLRAAQCFVNLLTIVGSSVNMWQQLCNCDIPISIKCDMKHLFGENYIYINYNESRSLRTLTRRFFKADKCDVGISWKSEQVDQFVRDLCDLVEHFDVKHTNFFLSTLMTGVLTHHLGWVATMLPNNEIKCKQSSNLFVRQLCDIYGAVGCPSKIAHTIITGKSEEELINKFINVLTYFIRFSDIQRIHFDREDVNVDHAQADKMCDDILCSSSNGNMDSYIPNQLEKHTLTNIRDRNSCHSLVTNNKSTNNNNNNNESFQLQDASAVETSHGVCGLKKNRTCLMDLSKLEETKETESSTFMPLNDSSAKEVSKVLFVLGADERLEMLNSSMRSKDTFEDADFEKCNSNDIKPSASCANLVYEGVKPKRAQSEEPARQATSTEKKSKTAKYRYSGVKFNFQQHPQIFENYMKSKNIELNDMHLQHKKDFMDGDDEVSNIDFSKYGDSEDVEDDEPLQTPSNASELEYTSDLVLPTSNMCASAKEVIEIEKNSNEFVRRTVPNTFVIPETQVTPLKTIELPMPSYTSKSPTQNSFVFTTTMIRSSSHTYSPNVALQGFIDPSKDWQTILKRDLILSAKHPITGDAVDESVAVVGNIDSWAVSVMSSHTYVIDKAVGGVPIGMSQMVANMLETLLKMWKLHTPPEYVCTSYVV